MSDLSTRNFLIELAKKNGIDPTRMEPIAKKLENEWFDTVGSLKDLTESQWSQLDLPLRVVDMIRKELQTLGTVEESRSTTYARMFSYLESQGNAAGSECVQTLQKIVHNILITNPVDDRVRRIKTTNPAFHAKVGRHELVLAYMLKLGFENDGGLLWMKSPDYTDLREVLLELNGLAANFGLPPKELPALPAPAEPEFNPYKAYVSNINPDQPSITSSDHDPAKFTQKINELEERKVKMARSETVERNALVFRAFGNVIPETAQSAMVDPHEEQQIYLGQMKKIIKDREAMSTFQNKRKNQFQRMKNNDIITKVTLRVRFPDMMVIQGNFNILENNTHLYNFIRESLQTPDRPFELFTTPPRIVTPVNRNKLEAFLPSTMFFFSWKDLRETTSADGPFLREDLVSSSIN